VRIAEGAVGNPVERSVEAGQAEHTGYVRLRLRDPLRTTHVNCRVRAELDRTAEEFKIDGSVLPGTDKP